MKLLSIRNPLLLSGGSNRVTLGGLLSTIKVLVAGIAVGFCLWARSEIVNILATLGESLQDFFILGRERSQDFFRQPDPLILSVLVGIFVLLILLSIVLRSRRSHKSSATVVDPEPGEVSSVDLSDLSVPVLARKTGLAQDIIRSLLDQETVLFPRQGENGIFFRSP